MSTPLTETRREWLNRHLKKTTTPRKSLVEGDVSEVVHNQLLKELDLECSIFEHTLTLEQLSDLFPLSRINLDVPSTSKGLNKDEASSRLLTQGRNVIYPVSGRAAFRVFLKQFSHTFRLLLLAASVICFIIFILDETRTVELILACTLLVLFIILCGVSYWQERSAKKNARGFQSILPSYCIAIRSAEKLHLNATDIVVGDIVFLSPGSRVPADLRLIYADELKLETSWITGELEPLDFHGNNVGKHISPLAAQNIAFKGCICMRGAGYGVVIRTGNETVLGKIVQMTSKEKGVPTRLELEHKRFVNFITILALVFGSVTFLFGLIITNFQHIVSTFVNGFLIIIIANIPQGLPITLGAALVIVARRLAKKNLYMKRLDVVETLGTASVVMCDKTGIFTVNDITVTDIWHELQYVTGGELKLKIGSESANQQFNGSLMNNHSTALFIVMSVCNKAYIEPITSRNANAWIKIAQNYSRLSPVRRNSLTIQSLLNGRIEHRRVSDVNDVQRTVRAEFHQKLITGSATEVALLKYVEEFANAEAIRKKYEILYDLPFNRQRRFQVVIVRERINRQMATAYNTKLYMLVKGAPEELLTNCTLLATSAGGNVQISEPIVESFSKAYSKFGNEGKSCMAFAIAELDGFNSLELESWGELQRYHLCFLGMAAMYDPPRDSVSKSLSRMKAAGVKCFMVTGDHPTTATAVAKHFALIAQDGTTTTFVKEKPNLSVIHCETLQLLTDQQWDDILMQKAVVFARAKPSHKLIIVKKCRERGDVVAVTGDGILDAPALKEANVGIAMEAVGSAFAKEAADMVFMEGDVKYIVESIEEGRLLYANLKKTIAYTLAHMVPELCAVMLTFAIGFPLGLSSLQILSIDLITEIPPSIALTYESAEKDVMRRGPRKKTSRLVSRALLIYSYIFVGIIISIGCLASYLWVFWHYSIYPKQLINSAVKFWHEGSPDFITSNGLVYNSMKQIRIHGQAKAAWQITLVMSQVFHFWLCTTRRISIFEHGIHNMIAVLAVLIEICLLNLMIYTPGVQDWIRVTHPPPLVWIFCIPVGIVLIIFSETRKWFIRRYPYSNVVRAFKW